VKGERNGRERKRKVRINPSTYHRSRLCTKQGSCRPPRLHNMMMTMYKCDVGCVYLDGRCVPYDGVVCRHALGLSSSVYVPASVADAVNVTDITVARQLDQLKTPQCRSITIDTLCRYAFPDCAGTAGNVKSKSLCRRVVLRSLAVVIMNRRCLNVGSNSSPLPLLAAMSPSCGKAASL